MVTDDKKLFSLKDFRSEVEIFSDLTNLTAQPGYIFAMAGICYRDNLVAYKGQYEASDLDYMFDRQRLNRNEITTLLGLLMRQPIDLTKPEILKIHEYVLRTDELMAELHSSMSSSSFGELVEISEISTELEEFWDGGSMREPIFYGAESAYHFQYRDFFLEKHICDDEWLQTYKGFTSAQAQKVARAICSLIDSRATEAARLNNEWKVGEIPKELVLSVFEFTPSEIAQRTSLDLAIVDSVFRALTFTGNNSQFKELGDFNGVAATPLLPTGRGSVLLFSHYTIYEALYESPFFWMNQDKAYKEKASDNRGAFAEKFSYRRLCAVFGEENVYTNVNIFRGKEKTVFAEADTLVIFGDQIIIVQAKAKKLTLAARKGNDQQLKMDFAAAIQKAYDQGSECANAMISGKCRLVDEHGRNIDLPQSIKEIYPFCLVSDHYPALAFQASQFLKFESNEIIQPPFVMDVFLLDTLAEMLDTPLRFFSYVRMRLKATDKIMTSHELTALAYHLRRNMWVEQEYNLILLEDSIAADLDTAMTVRREGMPGKRTPPGILTIMQGTLYERLISQIERRPEPAILETGFELLSMNEDACKDLDKILQSIIAKSKADGKNHDVTMVMNEGDNGFCIYCNPILDGNAISLLERHCERRKYKHRSPKWFGISIDLNCEIQFGIALDFPWEKSQEMEEITRTMENSMSKGAVMKAIERSLIPKKYGRNELCPCGSDKKYKKCCMN